jgi:hypothetical protein
MTDDSFYRNTLYYHGEHHSVIFLPFSLLILDNSLTLQAENLLKRINMKQKLLLFLAAMLPLLASAYDAKIDGIYYNFSGDEATVTYKQNTNYNYTSDYSGTVIIPESVTYNNKTYGVTSIGDHAFTSCNQLTSVVIPNSVTSISFGAFAWCSGLTSITLPNSVTSIEDYAYSGCSKLEEVNCYAEKVPSTNTDAFKDSYPQNATLYVPASAINDYKTTAPWSEFGTIKAIGGGETQKWPLLPSAMLTRN